MLELLKRKLKKLRNKYADADVVDVSYNNNDKSYWDFIIGWFLPIILLVVVWIFFMRRMGGGGGGSVLSISENLKQHYLIKTCTLK